MSYLPALAMPARAEGLTPSIPAHLRWSLPLVVDLDALLARAPGGALPAPGLASVPRAGLDLIRLQQRFGGLVLFLSLEADGTAEQLVRHLEPRTRVISVAAPEPGNRAMAAAAKWAAAQQYLGPDGFDYLTCPCGARAAEGAGGRLWILGGLAELAGELRQRSGEARLVCAEDRVPLRDLAAPDAAETAHMATLAGLLDGARPVPW